MILAGERQLSERRIEVEDLTRIVIDFVTCEGLACAAGIATRDTLAGGPPTADISYVLPDAKSAISFAVALDQSLIKPFLAKKDRRSYQHDHIHAHVLSSGIAFELSSYLEQRGYHSRPLNSNNFYRTDASPAGAFDLIPDISLRYLAVASGVASFGLSGNVLRKKEGAAIVLGGVVTSAQLEATPPLPAEENYCDGCRLCIASCASGLMDPEEESRVTLGGKEHVYSKRRSYHRCEYVCGGFTGLHPSGKWSTWSPGRLPIPETDEEFMGALARGVEAYRRRPTLDGGFYSPLLDKRIGLTCGNCQIICVADKEERKRRYKMWFFSNLVDEF
ncbi:MAG: epoxyqueuosine reductase [Candidatus Abyssobacteria bacterium SURF_5]|uniref:Epoxyqueuosine reductase n=1 Tax=Abyssobacteria bacterium (strain SURF_5) TaxID=2093360 RepID=A0A3A4N412_ABYX5|nr:MAG: epoxyqueuosine reductase [Candidatus Abyssubacteria bacterium SURF_5]